MRANSVMIIEDLRNLIEAFSTIRLRVRRNGEFYKNVLCVMKNGNRILVSKEDWLPITMLRDKPNPLPRIITAHNYLCTSYARLRNAWLRAEKPYFELFFMQMFEITQFSKQEYFKLKKELYTIDNYQFR